jgi:hypothetical protein
MNTLRLLSIALLVAVLAAGCDSGGNGQDAGPDGQEDGLTLDGQDAGDAGPDGGGDGDTGQEDGDAGQEDGDAGQEDGDAGQEDGDAGQEDGDAGQEDGDAGQEDGDAGQEDGDAGPDGGEDGGDEGGRILRATQVLGAGGFFGIQGALLGEAGALGAGVYGISGHYADLDGVIGGARPGGRLYLFQPGAVPARLDESVAQILEPPDGALQGGFGYSLGNLCDPNGDGQPDLPVGNHLWSASSALTAVGRAVVFWGDAQGRWTLGQASLHRLSAGLMARSDCMGQTVLCADVDGDGFDDLIAGGQNAGPNDTGLVAVFRGSAAGLSATEDLTLTPLHQVNRQYLGASSLWADLDGDGREDLAVGGWGLVKGEQPTGPHTGGVLVWLGGGDWTLGPERGLFPPGDAQILYGSTLALLDLPGLRLLLVGAPDHGVELGTPRGAVFVHQVGLAGFDALPPFQVLVPPAGFGDVGFGEAFAFAPDFAGQGRGALLVGMKHADASPENTGTGAVAVFPWDPAEGRFRAEADLLLSPAPLGFDGFGQAIIPVGDLDGDGLQDFAVGIPTHMEGDMQTGQQTGGVVFFH